MDDLEAYLAGLAGDECFAGRYWVASTTGSSGHKCIIPSDAQEWAMILASYARANHAGRDQRRLAAHGGYGGGQLHRAVARVRSGRGDPPQPVGRLTSLDAAAPPAQIVARPNELQPQVLIAYDSMVHMLAEEQLAGRLHIAPRAVNSASEPLTASPAARSRRESGRPGRKQLSPT